jgi:ABC-type uncharacterized transport system involved in gliding motility auxiliary subunit
MLNRILGLLGWLGVALVLSGVAVRFLRPEWQPLYSGLAIGGLVCTLLYVISQWREVARSFSGRSVRLGSLALGSVLLVLAILVGINYIASRQTRRWDLTANQVFSLSDQTRKILTGLDAPVQVRVFARSDDFGRFRDRLAEYASASTRVSVEYIDPDQKPAAATQYQVQSYGTVVFEYKGRTERSVGDGEQELTNALIKVVQGKQRKVYFVAGHGEKDPADASDRSGYSEIKKALESDNFVVEPLTLAQQQSVPEDATVLVIAGPKTDYLDPEIEMLKAYLARGGKVLFLLDPPDQPDSQPPAKLVALLHDWAIDAGNDVVVDASGMGRLLGTDASVPVAASYPSHPITDNFRILTAYPLARSMSAVSGGVGGRFAQGFIETGPRSWAESDLASVLTSGKVEMQVDQGDKPGPVTVGAAVSAPVAEGAAPSVEKDDAAAGEPKPETRVVAIGDSDFVSNVALAIQGNRDLFLNTVNWLAQQENLIAIRPREPEDRRITITADQEQMVFWLAVVFIPGVLLVTGVYTWWRRR